MTEVVNEGPNPKFDSTYQLEVGDVTADLCVMLHRVASMGEFTDACKCPLMHQLT